MRFFQELTESVRIAVAQILANKMRSALTALGVIIGIVAVTLMGTAINGIDRGFERSLAGFGDDILYVTKWPWRGVQDWWNYRNRRPIDVADVERINDWIAVNPDTPLQLAIPIAGRQVSVSRNEYKVDRIYTLGTSASYARVVRSEMEQGRFFSEVEAQLANDVAVIGFDVADALFASGSPVGRNIMVNGRRFRVVGVPARQGSFLGLFSWDSMIAIPINSFKRHFGVRNRGEIRVQVDTARMGEARDELRGVMRLMRGLGPEKKDDFEINDQQFVRDQLDPIKNGMAVAGLSITSLALFVGAIGIANITYVSVRERTREIGTRKALGARRRTILLQFLIEAVAICCLGGVMGILAAWALAEIGGVIAPKFPLVFSPGLIVVGLVISIGTGVISGFAPAVSASRLDPVEALRYE